MPGVLRVGIVGASAERGWAKESHVPAVQKLAGFELTAVAAGDQVRSDAAAKAFGAQKAFADAKNLVRDTEIDLVSIAVKVPDHRELLLAALAARKHVYCEWPLGRNLAEARELAAAAEKAGVHVAIGLQTRHSPAALKARELIASGAIGRPLSARLYSSTVAFSREISKSDLYLENPESGATLVSIHGGHAIDLALALLGPLEELSALGTTQYSDVKIRETGAEQKRSIPDHFLLQGRLQGGIPLSVEVAGGCPPEQAVFRLEVTGENANLNLDGGAPRGFQSGRLRLKLNGRMQHLEEGEAADLLDTAANVAFVYAALRDDIHRGVSTATGFEHAMRLTRLCEDLVSSSHSGVRCAGANWPVS